MRYLLAAFVCGLALTGCDTRSKSEVASPLPPGITLVGPESARVNQPFKITAIAVGQDGTINNGGWQSKDSRHRWISDPSNGQHITFDDQDKFNEDGSMYRMFTADAPGTYFVRLEIPHPDYHNWIISQREIKITVRN